MGIDHSSHYIYIYIYICHSTTVLYICDKKKVEVGNKITFTCQYSSIILRVLVGIEIQVICLINAAFKSSKTFHMFCLMGISASSMHYYSLLK